MAHRAPYCLQNPRKKYCRHMQRLEHLFDVNGNPNHESEERAPESASTTPAKVVATVNMVPALDGDNLVHLPQRRHQKQLICLGHVRLEEHNADMGSMHGAHVNLLARTSWSHCGATKAT